MYHEGKVSSHKGGVLETQIVEQKSLAILAEEMSRIEQILSESGGELTPDLEAQLANIDIQTASKIDGYYAFMERLESDGMLWEKRATEMQKIADGHFALKERLKKAILVAMSTLGKDEIKGNMKRAKLQATAGRLVVNEKILPEEYKITVVTKKPDNEMIRAKLDAFEDVPGASIEGGVSIRFYNVKPGGK